MEPRLKVQVTGGKMLLKWSLRPGVMAFYLDLWNQ